MLHSGASEGLRHPTRDEATAGSRVLLAVASPPRLSDPSRWGWPHWLATPAFRVGGHRYRSPHRPLEDYR